MPSPEHPKTISLTLLELTSELEEIERQLELSDENENQIERFFMRDKLLEQQDWLHAQIDELNAQ